MNQNYCEIILGLGTPLPTNTADQKIGLNSRYGR